MASKKHNSRIVVETQQIPWIRLGTIDATAAAADVALGVAERDYATNKALDNVVVYRVPYGVNAMEARLLLTTADADVDLDVWAGRIDGAGDAEMSRVCTIDCICGTQDANDSTHHYADTLTLTNDNWLKAVAAIIPAENHQARIAFDLCGYDVVLFHGYGTFDEDTIIEITGF